MGDMPSVLQKTLLSKIRKCKHKREYGHLNCAAFQHYSGRIRIALLVNTEQPNTISTGMNICSRFTMDSYTYHTAPFNYTLQYFLLRSPYIYLCYSVAIEMELYVMYVNATLMQSLCERCLLCIIFSVSHFTMLILAWNGLQLASRIERLECDKSTTLFAIHEW